MAILISALLTAGLYKLSVGWLRDSLDQRIRDTVAIGSTCFSGEDFNQFTEPEQEGSSEFLQLQKHLRQIRDAANGYRFVYAVRKAPDGSIIFIVDAEEDPAEVSHLGEIYGDAGPSLKTHIDTMQEPMVEQDFYTDKWGTWLTGYAPIKGKDGKTCAILCMDVAASTIKEQERAFLWAAITAFAITLPLSLLVGVQLGRTLAKPIKALTQGAERIAGGDLDYTVKADSHDEIGELADAFNTMTGKLSHTLDDLQKSESELIEHRDHLEELVHKRTASLEEANQRMRKDLMSAAEVQQAFLPQHPPQMPGVDFAWNFTPCNELAGDMLDICKIDKHRVGLWVADVCGHGVASTLVSVSLSRLLSNLQDNGETEAPFSLPDGAAFLNEHFSWNSESMRYFTLLYGILDTRTHEFRYVSAGHPGPIRVTKDGKADNLPMSPPAIGILPNPEFIEHQVTLEPGDRIYLYTDGITEASNSEQEEFGELRLTEKLGKLRSNTLTGSIDALLKELSIWQDDEQPADDLSIVALELK